MHEKKYPDSKLMQLIDLGGTLIGLNFLFIIFCLPIFTIGSAYSALYAACRAEFRGEPSFKLFFTTFFKDFKKPTIIWVSLLPLNAALVFSAYTIWFYQQDGYIPVFLVSVFAVVATLGITSMCLLFNAFFECTTKQLFKNGLLVFAANPLRGMLVGIISWLPLIMLALLPITFLQMIMIWIFLYFAVATAISFSLMKKPFNRLQESFAAALEEAEAAKAEAEAAQAKAAALEASKAEAEAAVSEAE